MTEKRFNVFDVDGTIFLEDHKEGSYHIGEIGNVDVNCLNDIADKLNKLSEQADAVREELRLCEEENTELQKEIEQLNNENKQLKELIADKNKTQTETLKQLTQTQKELITIKNTIKDMYDNERTHLGHNVLAQLMEAIQ